jgi:hypothetical protein
LNDAARKANAALLRGSRLLSADDAASIRLWIITEWDSSVTTVLMPEDY